jgi:hypothetical protein
MGKIVFAFPSRRTVHVERDRNSGGWLVIHGDNGWNYATRDAAMREAAELFRQWSATLVAESE